MFCMELKSSLLTQEPPWQWEIPHGSICHDPQCEPWQGVATAELVWYSLVVGRESHYPGIKMQEITRQGESSYLSYIQNMGRSYSCKVNSWRDWLFVPHQVLLHSKVKCLKPPGKNILCQVLAHPGRCAWWKVIQLECKQGGVLLLIVRTTIRMNNHVKENFMTWGCEVDMWKTT